MLQFATLPITIKQVWRNGFKLTREGWMPLYIVFLLNQLIIAAPVYFANNNEQVLAHYIAHHAVISMLAIIAGSLMTLILYAIAFYRLGGLLKGNACEFHVALQRAIKKLPWLFLASLLSVVVTVLGTVAFIIPGIYIAVVMFYYFPAIILDDKPIFAALKYTFTIVWGHWWRAFVVMAVPIIVALFVNGIFAFIVTLIAGLIQPEAIYHAVPQYIVQIFNVVFQAYIGILVLSMQLFQWNDMKIRKEQGALQKDV